MGQRSTAMRTSPGVTDAPGCSTAASAATEPTESAATASRRRRLARLLALGALRAATVQAPTDPETAASDGDTDAKLDR